jgi:hypothetical protein
MFISLVVPIWEPRKEERRREKVEEMDKIPL